MPLSFFFKCCESLSVLTSEEMNLLSGSASMVNSGCESNEKEGQNKVLRMLNGADNCSLSTCKADSPWIGAL